MIDRNETFDYVYGKILTAFPDAFVSSKFEPVPAAFPAVFVRETGRFAVQNAVTFGGTQGVHDVTYEVQIQSNDTDAPATEVQGLFVVIYEAFRNLSYRLEASNILEDGTGGIYRTRYTFRRVLGDSDAMPVESAPVLEPDVQGDNP